MDPLSVPAINSIGESLRDQRNFKERQPTDSKIHDFIVSHINLPALKEGTLLASATSPQLVIPAITGKKSESDRKKEKKRREGSKQLLGSRYYPIGLMSELESDWINALMQFVLFIPTLRELFAYTPFSFYPFNQFIDQYFHDIQEGEFVSSARCSDLVYCLLAKFPALFKKDPPMNLHEMILCFHKAAVSFGEIQDIYLKQEWQMVWDPQEKFAPFLSEKTEWLIGRIGEKTESDWENSLERYYLLDDRASCFELDAFIEHRLDDDKEGAYYTYLKIEEGWVQCGGERICLLSRGTMLYIPLRRGILFHYRKIPLRKHETLRG